MFDDLLLMAEGKVVYLGPAQEEALNYFSQLGSLSSPSLLFSKFFPPHCGI